MPANMKRCRFPWPHIDDTGRRKTLHLNHGLGCHMTAKISDAGQFLTRPARDSCVVEGVGLGEAEVIEQAVPNANVGHAVTRDRVNRDESKPAMLDYLRHAQMKSGRSPMELVREFFRLNRGPGKLTLAEYVQYGVFDTTRLSPDEQSQFLSNTLHWPITRICCDMTWQATTEDKWLCSHILARSGVRVPETLAVIDKTERSYLGTHKISTAGQFRDFVTSRDIVPFRPRALMKMPCD